MSTAKFDTLSNLAGTQTVPVATVAQGVSRAWVNFNGTGTVAIRAAFNVSSITDNGTGNYTVNFTTAMADTNYVTTYSDYSWGLGYQEAFTTTSFRTVSMSNNFTVNDVAVILVAVFR